MGIQLVAWGDWGRIEWGVGWDIGYCTRETSSVRYEHVTQRNQFFTRPAFPLLSNLSHSVGPWGVVHADLLTKHKRRVRVCRKTLLSSPSHSPTCPVTSATSYSHFPVVFSLSNRPKNVVEHALSSFISTPTLEGPR